MNFTEDLPDDVLSGSLLRCAAPDALQAAGACQALRASVAVTARRLFATLFGSRALPQCLQESLPRLLVCVDRARSPEPQSVRETFTWAASYGYTSLLRRAAAAWDGEDSLLDARGADGATPLACAAKRRQGDAVATLLVLRADVDAESKEGRTALYWAARHGDASTAQRLVEGGACPTKVTKRGDCPLGAALNVLGQGGCTPGRLEAMRLMAESLNSSQRASEPAVRALTAACQVGEVPYVALLLRNGVVAAVPAQGARAASAAATAAAAPPASSPPVGAVAGPARTPNGDLGLVVAGGAAPSRQRPPSATSRGGRRAGAGGAAGTRGAQAGAGGGGGAESSFPQTTPLLEACSKGFNEIVDLLLDGDAHSRAGINIALPSGKCALHLAAERNDRRCCAALLCARASLDTVTCGGRSALYAAAEHGHAHAVEALCEHAEVRHLRQQTPNGVSAVALAERRGKPSLLLPMLSCYQRHVRRPRTGKRTTGIVEDVADSYLTTLCLRYQEQLALRDLEYKQAEEADSDADICPLPRACVPLGASAAIPGGEPAAVRARSATPGRHQRVMDNTRRGADGSIEGRGNLRRQLGLAGVSDAEAANAAASIAASRRPWGSAACSRSRPASASGRPPPAAPCGALVARMPSSEFWRAGSVRAAAAGAATVGAAAPAAGCAVTLPPLPGATRAGYPQPVPCLAAAAAALALRREEAAIEADDAMALLLDGYFSDEDDANTPHEWDHPDAISGTVGAGPGAPASVMDGMYSDATEEGDG